MIPKIIHYCWFGGNPLPELAEKCIESWKKYCPDYEIKRWDESNFDINCYEYVKEAYEAKKWAFVSDVARIYALVNFGGIYMDTDVEVIKPIDGLLKYKAVSEFESDKKIPTGLMACEKDNVLFKELLEEYNSIHFILEDGSLNLKTVCERETDILKLYGLKGNGCMQNVCGTTVFPKDYFSPKDYVTQKVHITERTYSIHHYAYSWQGEKENISSKIYRCLYKIFGAKFANKVRDIFGKKN